MLRSAAVVLVVLAGCPSPTDTVEPPTVGRLAEDLVLLDDFTGSTLDGVWRWAEGDTVRREIVDGALVMAARDVYAETAGIGGVVNNLRTGDTGRIDHVRALVSVEDYASFGSGARVHLGLRYQPEADRGTSMNLIDIRVQLQSWAGQLPWPGINAYRCLDADCETFEELPVDGGIFPWEEQVDLGDARQLEIEYDESVGTFSLAVDGRVATVFMSDVTGFSADDFVFAELRAQAYPTSDAGQESAIEARVHTFEVNGQVYDDFSVEHLDATRWQLGDVVRRQQDGALVLALSSDEAATRMLPLRGASGIHELAATVRVEALRRGEDAATARLGGVWYAAADVARDAGLEDHVLAWVGLQDNQAVWTVALCEDATCDDVTPIAQGVLEDGVPVGDARQLYVGFNGTHFTFQSEDDAPVSFDVVTAGYAVFSKGNPGPKGPMVHQPAPSEGWGAIRATFDDVRTNPPGTLALTGDRGARRWKTTAFEGRLGEVVVVGPDPQEPGAVVLRAQRTDASGAPIEALTLVVGATDWSAPMTVYGGTLLTDGDASIDVSDGTVTLSRFDGEIVAGAFAATLSSGEEVNGTFTAPWVESTRPIEHAATPALPTGIDDWCSEWLFCDHTVPGDRVSALAFYLETGASRAVRVQGGAELLLFDTNGATVLCEDRSSGATEKLCRITEAPTTGWYYAMVTPHAASAERLRLSIHEDFIDAEAGNALDLETPVGARTWLRYPTPSGGPYKATLVTQDVASGGLDMWDGRGRYLIGNGWCCSSGNTQESFTRATEGGLWVRVDVGEDQSWTGHTESTHHYTLTVAPASTGAQPDQAVQRAPSGDVYAAFNYTFGADDELYLRFDAERSGPHLVWVEVMSWRPVDGPVDLMLFEAPADPEGTALRTTEGAECESVPRNGQWAVACYALLTRGQTYYARMRERLGRAGVHGVFRVDLPWVEADTFALSTVHTSTLSTTDTRGHVWWLDEGNGYAATVTTSHALQDTAWVTLIDHATPTPSCEFFCNQELARGETANAVAVRYVIDASQAPPFLELDVHPHHSGSLGFQFGVAPVGEGNDARSPFELPNFDPSLTYSRLPGGGSHYYAFRTVGQRLRTFTVESEDWAGGSFTLTQSGGTGGSVTCNAALDRGIYRAACEYTLPDRADFVLRVIGGSSGRPTHYTLRVQ